MLPTLLLACGIGRSILNHFYVRAPYLLDSGLLSKVVYRNGIDLPLPEIAVNYARTFYEVHVSPLCSLFSALSYLVPVGRIEWFAFVEALLYAPIGLAVWVVASRLDPAGLLRRVGVTMVTALAFAFSGFVLWLADYPHIEVATPGLVCIVLGAFVTGRTRLAWVALAAAVSVKQDGGLHVATALLPLWFLHRRGVVMSVDRRTVKLAVAIAILIPIVEVTLQKLLLTPYPRLTHAYLGDPLYGHLSWQLLADRLLHFFEHDQVIYYPIIATGVIAAVTRDWRYLLGWLSVLPWFVVNLTAAEESKAWFVAYGIAPFIVGLFWVYLYGAHLAPRRLRPVALEASFALVCMASTLGAYREQPVGIARTVHEMAISHDRDRGAVTGFVDALVGHRAQLGRLQLDYAVSALGVESFVSADRWVPHAPADTIALHRNSAEHDALLGEILTNHLDVCTHVLDTRLVACAHTSLAEIFHGLASEDLPAITAIRANALGVLVAGRYTWTVHAATGRLEVLHGDTILGASDGTLAVTFDAPGDDVPLHYRLVPDAPITAWRLGMR